MGPGPAIDRVVFWNGAVKRFFQNFSLWNTNEPSQEMKITHTLQLLELANQGPGMIIEYRRPNPSSLITLKAIS
jgi:hypothetical protein